jgi:hypothetical protein
MTGNSVCIKREAGLVASMRWVLWTKPRLAHWPGTLFIELLLVSSLSFACEAISFFQIPRAEGFGRQLGLVAVVTTHVCGNETRCSQTSLPLRLKTPLSADMPPATTVTVHRSSPVENARDYSLLGDPNALKEHWCGREDSNLHAL